MPIYSGNQKLKTVYGPGGQKLKEVWEWSGTAWRKLYSAVVPFNGAGIVKSGNQSIPINQWTQVAGWSIHPSYPGTIRSGEGFAVPSGVTVNLAAQTLRGGGAHSTNQTRILANGTAIAEGGGDAAASVSLTGYTTTAETLFTIDAFANFSTRANIQSGANTFLTAVRV